MPALRYCVVWGQRMERESYFSDRALADAYAAAHHGVVVVLAAMSDWPADSSHTPHTL